MPRLRSAFYRYVLKKNYILGRDPQVARMQAKDATRRLKQLGSVDAVIVTYLSNGAYLETNSPVVIIHDATWAQVLDYYAGYERSWLSAATVYGGMELERRALQRCDHAIYSSRWAASSAINDFGIPPQKVSVAPLGASLAAPPTREDISTFLLRRGHGPMKLFFVGKEWERKGGDVAVQVALEIERQGVAVELHVAGCNPSGDLPPLVKQYGMLRKDVPQKRKSYGRKIIHLTRVWRVGHDWLYTLKAACFQASGLGMQGDDMYRSSL